MSTGVSFAASADILAGGTRLRMLRDRILLRPLDWEPSTILTIVRSGRPVRGEVVSVGPGRLYRRYRNKGNGKRDYVETAHFIPTQVKVGDVVELGGLNAYDGQGYNFPQITIGTETYLICQEQDIAGIVEQEAA
jgi:co-chaperonin GroES (HSP10)